MSRQPAHHVGVGHRLGPESARPIALVGGPGRPPPARHQRPIHAVLGPLQLSRRPGSLGGRRQLGSGQQPRGRPCRSTPGLCRSGILRSPHDGRCGRPSRGESIATGTIHAGSSSPWGRSQGAQGRGKEPRDSKPELAMPAPAPPTAGYRARRAASGASLSGSAARAAHSGRARLRSNSAAQQFLSAGGRRPRF